jgi:hypothetical protein
MPRRIVVDKRAGWDAEDFSGLAEELFSLVEFDQGKAFISDGIGVLTRQSVVNLAKQSLEIYQRRLIPKLERFIKKHSQRPDAATRTGRDRTEGE